MRPLLSIVQSLHSRWVLERRFQVLADALTSQIPAGAAVLDVGCGDGTIGSLLLDTKPGISIQGLELAARPGCRIPCATFDGAHIPFEDSSFDVCLFVDVLHHTEQIRALLREACRVSRKLILIKDHLCENSLDFATLKLMDWVGNRPHGVVLPYNYQSRKRWMECFASCGLQVLAWKDFLPIYPFPFSALFGRGLHFVVLLEKVTAGAGKRVSGLQGVAAPG